MIACKLRGFPHITNRASLFLLVAHYFRHSWDVPICWIDRRFIIVSNICRSDDGALHTGR